MGLFGGSTDKRRRIRTGKALSEDAHVLVAILQCPVCQDQLVDPVTFSCGNTVCKGCIQQPENEGWPLECPVQSCSRKTHAVNEIRTDVTLSKVLDVVRARIQPFMVEQSLAISSASRSPRITEDYEGDSHMEDDFDQSSWDQSAAKIQRKTTNRFTTSTVSTTSTASDLSIQSSSRQAAAIRDHSVFKEIVLTELECQVCYLVFYEPLTTPCGHTFCKSCIMRSLDHGDKCPLCRGSLPGFSFFHSHPINSVLTTILTSLFSIIYQDRAAGLKLEMEESLRDTPIFVCSLAFPKMPVFLHVFEPRYRLMLRRAMESNRRFGMVLPARTGGGACLEYGTMLEIRSVELLQDGRSVIETIGSFRFKLLERGSRDGYTIGKIERIDDISHEEEVALERQDLALNDLIPEETTPPPQGESSSTPSSSHPPPPAQGITQLQVSSNPSSPPNSSSPPSTPTTTENKRQRELPTEELMKITRDFIEALRSGSAPWLQQRLNNTYGDMPTDMSDFSFWVGSVMPIDEFEKAKLLPIRSVRLRFKLIVHWILQLQQQWWFNRGCSIH